VLVHGLDLGQHRHEIRIAVPARHDVKVDVVGDAGARRAAGVGADVEALWPQRFAQDRDRPLRGAHERGGLGVVEVVELGPVRDRGDHDVAGVVGKLVQHHDRALGPPHDELGIRVVGVLDHAAEEAARLRLGGDVLHAPGRPQSLH